MASEDGMGGGGGEEMGPRASVGQVGMDAQGGPGFLGLLAVFRGGRELRRPRRAAGVEPLSLAPAGGASVEPPRRVENGRGCAAAMGGAGGSERGRTAAALGTCEGALAGSGTCAGRAASGGPALRAGGNAGPGSHGSTVRAGRGRAAVGGRGSAVRTAGAGIAAGPETGAWEQVSPLLEVFPGVQRILGPGTRGCLYAREGRRRGTCCRAMQSVGLRPGRGEPPGASSPSRGPRSRFTAPRGCRPPFYDFLLPLRLCLLAGVARASDCISHPGARLPRPPDEPCFGRLHIRGEHLGAGDHQASPEHFHTTKL